jgi:hypothetical protein
VPEPLEPTLKFGQDLFNAVFTREVRDLYVSSRISAKSEGEGLRLRLRFSESPELANLPWEFLNDGRDFIALADDFPLVRYLDLPSPPRPSKVELPLRILVTVSAPLDLPPLDVEAEKARLLQSLDSLIAAGRVEVHFTPDASLKNLQRTLRKARSAEKPFHVWHYIGHGTFDLQRKASVLSFTNESGVSESVSGFQLGTLFDSYPGVRLVMLNACEGARSSVDDPFAGVAAALVESGISAVIAMQFEISDRAAIVLAEEFYAAIVDGLPIDSALTEARRAVFFMPNWVEWATPVLFLRAPDGVLFEISAAALAEKPVEAAAADVIPEPELQPPGETRPQEAPPKAEPEAILPEVPVKAAPVVEITQPPAEPTPAVTTALRGLPKWVVPAGIGGAFVVVVFVVLSSLGIFSPGGSVAPVAPQITEEDAGPLSEVPAAVTVPPIETEEVVEPPPEEPGPEVVPPGVTTPPDPRVTLVRNYWESIGDREFEAAYNLLSEAYVKLQENNYEGEEPEYKFTSDELRKRFVRTINGKEDYLYCDIRTDDVHLVQGAGDQVRVAAQVIYEIKRFDCKDAPNHFEMTPAYENGQWKYNDTIDCNRLEGDEYCIEE